MSKSSKGSAKVKEESNSADGSEDENAKDAKNEKDASQHSKVFKRGDKIFRTCQNVFLDGVIPERNVVFCIDTSGSMYKILDTIKEHLVETITKHAAKENSPFFNIIEFNTAVTVWCEKMVPCTESTVKVAKRWLSNLAAKTGTNTRDALLAALEFPECEAVYLVSDGVPDSDMDELLDSLAYAVRGRPVHVIYVCQGLEDEKTHDVLRLISRETFGHFRVVAFGTQGLTNQGTLLTDEVPAVRQVRSQKGNMFPDEAMCGVHVRDAESIHASRAVFEPKYTDVIMQAGYAQPTALGITQDPLRDPLVRPVSAVPGARGQNGSDEMEGLLRDSMWPGGHSTSPSVALSGDTGSLQPRPPPSATWSRYRPSRAFIAAKEKQYREFDDASKCPVGGALLIGKTVLCRMDDKHAYYRKGHVKSQIRENVYLIELPPVKPISRRDPSNPAGDYVPTDYQEVTGHNLIDYDDALRHRVKRGDRVLAPIGVANRIKFLPGTVTDGEEWREPLCITNDRRLNVLFEDGKTQTVPVNSAILITEDTFRRLTLESKMPPSARSDLRAVAGYPERSLPGYPVDPIPREPREYSHARPHFVQPESDLLVDHLTPSYHRTIRKPVTDCNCYEDQPEGVVHAVTLDTVEKHAHTEREYPSDDEKRVISQPMSRIASAKRNGDLKRPVEPVRPAKSPVDEKEAKVVRHQRRRASIDSFENESSDSSECEHLRKKRKEKVEVDVRSDSSDSEAWVRKNRKPKEDYYEELRAQLGQGSFGRSKAEEARTANWYEDAARLIRRSRGDSEGSSSGSVSPRFDTTELDRQLLQIRKRIQKVQLSNKKGREKKRKESARPRSASLTRKSRSKSSRHRRRSQSRSASSSSSSSSESESESDSNSSVTDVRKMYEKSSRAQQTDEASRRRELERLLQRRRKKSGQETRSSKHSSIDRMQLRNKTVQAGPPAKPAWRYWRNDPPPNLLAPPTFDTYNDPSQPVLSVELHKVRASSAKGVAEKPTTQPRKQEGYVDKYQQVLQRRFEEAMHREEERQEKRATKHVREQQAALRALNPEVAHAKLDKERFAIRERIEREHAAQRAQRAQRDLAVEQQREAERTRLIAERNAAKHVLQQQRRSESQSDNLRDRGSADQLRLARVACEEAARMHSELSRTNAETALNLRKYEVRKEVNNDYLNKYRIDPNKL